MANKCVIFPFLQNHDWKRLLMSAFMHADEAHLVYNMVSFLWKGVQLEGALGSAQFTKLIALLTLLSQGCTLLVAKLLADQLGIKVSWPACFVPLDSQTLVDVALKTGYLARWPPEMP